MTNNFLVREVLVNENGTAEKGEEAKERKNMSGYGPEIDAVAVSTRHFVPKDNVHTVLSTTWKNLGKLSVDSH